MGRLEDFRFLQTGLKKGMASGSHWESNRKPNISAANDNSFREAIHVLY